MIFLDIPPSPALQPYVRTFRLVHLSGPAAELKSPYPTRLEQALVFFVRGHIHCFDPLKGKSIPIARNALFGQQVSRLDFYPISDPDFLMLMVVFQPAGLYRLLGLPSGEFICEFCDAELVMSSELQVLNDQIAYAKNYDSIIELAENFFVKKAKLIKIEAHPIDDIGRLLMTNPSPFSLDYLADQACLGPRQFERKFKERMGIGPKLFSRIGRFFNTLQYKEANPHLDWLSIAIDFGYSDYNHLVKDFKKFAHVTPNLIVKDYNQRAELIVKNPLLNILP